MWHAPLMTFYKEVYMADTFASVVVDSLLFLTLAPWLLILVIPVMLMFLGLIITVAAPFIMVVGRQKYIESIRVLMVDDNPSSLMLIRDLLTSYNCSLTVVESGKKAIEALNLEKFDLMILDNYMPEMTGAETLLNAEKQLTSKFTIERANTPVPVIEYSSAKDATICADSLRHFAVVGKFSKDLPPSMLKPLISDILTSVVGHVA